MKLPHHMPCKAFLTGAIQAAAARGACLAVLLVATAALQVAAAASDTPATGQALQGAEKTPSAAKLTRPPGTGKPARFGHQHASGEVSGLAAWIVDSRDNQGMPFMIVDKVNAQVLVFDTDGLLKGAAPALLGLARGDESTPGIGERKLSTILPHERTTPAGRFVASLDRNIHGAEILWIDYATSISLHKVVKGTPREQRAQRLSSPTAADNRVSFGCINVPVIFYDKVVSPAFTGTNGVVYILPETRTAHDVFGSYEVDAAASPTVPPPIR
ncbi:MAG: hypothetical protein ABIR76_07740 [Polaromonas sp.]